MATVRLFDRKAKLTIARPLGSSFFENGPNAIVIKDLRVRFEIVKDLEEEPNNSKIMIFNLSAKTRSALQQKPLHVQLDVGYVSNIARVFTGQIRWIEHVRDGTEWVTTIEAGDGERAFRSARVNRSFKPGTSGLQALEEVAKTMGLKVPKNVSDAKELLNQFVSGVVLEGPSRRELSRVLSGRGFQWSIQDGRLQILAGRETLGPVAVVISEANGLVGSPAYGQPPIADESPLLRVETLIDTRIRPGGRIRVEAAAITGNFRVARVTHSGDTHGKDWISSIEANPL